ncbi:MAG: hypothetical protein ACKKL4_01315 [Patescibacteria group bacterium]
MQIPETSQQTDSTPEHHEKNIHTSIEELTQEVAETKEFLQSTFSLRMIVMRGVLTGFAVVLGSTVLASIIFTIVQLVFGDVPYIPN